MIPLTSAWASPSFFHLSVSVVSEVSRHVANLLPLIRQTGFFYKGGESLIKAAFSKDLAPSLQPQADKSERVFWQTVHGGLLLVAGVCGIWSEMEWLLKGVSTPLSKELFYWNSGFFFLSSLVGLQLSAEAFHAASEIEDEEKRQKVQFREILNILSNLSFITGSLLFLTGNALFVAIVVCALGSALSITPLLLDYYSVN